MSYKVGAHLEEGQSDPEENLGPFQEQDVPDAHSGLSRERCAEKTAEPAPCDLLQSQASIISIFKISHAHSIAMTSPEHVARTASKKYEPPEGRQAGSAH